MLAKRTYKNQITLPQAIANLFPGVEYFDVQKRDQEIILKPVRIGSAGEELEGIRKKIAKLGITQKDIDGAVLWARKTAV